MRVGLLSKMGAEWWMGKEPLVGESEMTFLSSARDRSDRAGRRRSDWGVDQMYFTVVSANPGHQQSGGGAPARPNRARRPQAPAWYFAVSPSSPSSPLLPLPPSLPHFSLRQFLLPWRLHPVVQSAFALLILDGSKEKDLQRRRHLSRSPARCSTLTLLLDALRLLLDCPTS